jgi:VIT1/CCC1 family predicted Fe2+/Mn2+ transporter
MPSSPGWPPRSAPASAWPSPKACPTPGTSPAAAAPYLRGSITGAGTFLGGVLHTLPFLIPAYHAALIVALATVAFELVTLAWIRARFFSTSFFRSFISVALGGAIIAAVSAALGAVG